MEKQMTVKEIVEETVEYYSKNPRAVYHDESGHPQCYYFNAETGRKCAVGRCMIQECAEELYDDQRLQSIENFQEKLLPQYRGHEVSFWESLQVLHDSDCYWDGNQLTDLGKKRMTKILESYGE